MEPTDTGPLAWIDLIATPLAQRQGAEFWLLWGLLLLATAACFYGAFRFLRRHRAAFTRFYAELAHPLRRPGLRRTQGEG